MKSLVNMTCTRSRHSVKQNETITHVLFLKQWQFKTKTIFKKQTKINF